MQYTDFDNYDYLSLFDENSYHDQEAQRLDREEMAIIDECLLDDEIYGGEYDDLESELDAAFGDDSYWEVLDAEFENTDELI